MTLVHGNHVQQTQSVKAPTSLADIGVDLSLIAVDKDLLLKLHISLEDSIVGAHLMKGIKPETFSMYDWQNTQRCYT